MNDAIDALTRKVWPSVVQISVSSYGVAREKDAVAEASMVLGRQQSVGSGFVVDADGYIITNAHVVANAQRIELLLPPEKADGSLATALSAKQVVVPAHIVGLSSELDLALLKVDNLKLPALPLATYSQVRQGETVFAFGSPSGLRHTLTHGLVSSVARQIDPDSPLIYIQTDAPINPGQLRRAAGEHPRRGGWRQHLHPLAVRRERRPRLRHSECDGADRGASVAAVRAAAASGDRHEPPDHHTRYGRSLALSRDYGVIVSDVWPKGPAEAAGLHIGDILVSVDGQPAENLPTVTYNFRLRESTDPVKLVVLRGTANVSLSITPVEVRRASSTRFRTWPTCEKNRRERAWHPWCRDRSACRQCHVRSSRPVRHRRDRASGRREERDSAPAARRHPLAEQQEHLHAESAAKHPAGTQTRQPGDAAAAARGPADVTCRSRSSSASRPEEKRNLCEGGALSHTPPPATS